MGGVRRPDDLVRERPSIGREPDAYSIPLRARIAIVLVFASLAAAAIVAIAFPIARTPAFHHYADQRTWLGIPHAGDVVSNLPFLLAGMWALARAPELYARLACAGVIAIGLGSAAYHVAPSDLTLAFDWGPIALALMLITAAVIDDRLGARAGGIALVVGPLLAIASVLQWIAGGGTHGGTVTPYGAVQALGVTLPALLALVAPGRIPRAPLLVAVLLFAVARLCAAHDRELLEAVAISGHSLKHLAAAAAAACALHALTSRATGSRASRATTSRAS